MRATKEVIKEDQAEHQTEVREDRVEVQEDQAEVREVQAEDPALHQNLEGDFPEDLRDRRLIINIKVEEDALHQCSQCF